MAYFLPYESIASLEYERKRLQSLAEQHLKDAMRPLSLGELAADIGDEDLTDAEIVGAVMETFDLSLVEAKRRIQNIDFDSLGVPP